MCLQVFAFSGSHKARFTLSGALFEAQDAYNLRKSGLRSAVEAGELTSNTRGRGMNTASRTDLAEAAAVVLTQADNPVNAYNFTGRLWTYPEVAAALSEVSGRSVSYREVDHDDGAVGMMGLAPLIQSGGFELQTPDLQAVLGRPPASQHDAVTAALRH